MASEQVGNDYSSTLSGAALAGDATVTVASASGAPAPNFRLRVDNELMLVTLVAGSTFTVTRGIESTAAAAHSSGAVVAHVLTAGGISQYRDETIRPQTIASMVVPDGYNYVQASRALVSGRLSLLGSSRLAVL